MLFDYCLFYSGRSIPSHGEVHSVFISHWKGRKEGRLMRGGSRWRKQRIVCNYCVLAEQ